MKIQLTLAAVLVSETITLVMQAKPLAKKEPKKSERPNILFCIADDASYHHFSANGSRWVNTPNFDAVANHGILFSNCYTANAKSGPSRACVLTGLYSWQSREAVNHVANFPPDLKVVTEVLAENGYDVAFTGKGWAPGYPGKNANGTPRELTGKSFQKLKLTPPTEGINSVDYTGNFIEFLDKNKGDKPWFFWFGSHEPHRFYEFGSAERLNNKKKNLINDFPAFLPDNDSVRADLLDYGLEIEYFDYQLGLMLKELDRRGVLDNTIIVITSDNGMPFPRSKANNYEYSNHMPLAIMWKKGISNPGRKVSDYINFVDFTPTFLDVSKIDMKKSGMETSPGSSLVNIFKSKKDGWVDKKRNFTILGRERDDFGRPQNQGYPIRGIIKNNLLYINNLKHELWPAGNRETGYLDVDASPSKTGILNLARQGKDSIYWKLSFAPRNSEELYDISVDKFCMNDLSKNPKYNAQKEAMKKQLFSILKSQNDPRMTGEGDIFDQYPYDIRMNNAWNFWEKVVSGEILNPWDFTKWVNPTDYDTYYYNQPSKH